MVLNVTVIITELMENYKHFHCVHVMCVWCGVRVCICM